MTKPLRAVGPDEVKPAPAPRSVSDAAENGSTRELLVAMRNRIAKAVENERTPARDLAALTKRLGEVVKEIEAIDAKAEQESTEDVAEDETWSSEAL